MDCARQAAANPDRQVVRGALPALSGRFQEALEAQQALEKEYAAAGEVNRDVLEEITANRPRSASSRES
jgi:hypothetical protein